MLGNLNGPTLVVILFIVLLLFGAPKLPGLAKSLGQSMKILKKEVRSDSDAATDEAAGPAAAPEANAAQSASSQEQTAPAAPAAPVVPPTAAPAVPATSQPASQQSTSDNSGDAAKA